MENKEKEPTLKEVIKDRCIEVDSKLNSMNIKKRKTIILLVFFIGISILIINIFITSYINKPKEDVDNEEIVMQDSLEIISKEIDILFKSIYSDSTAFDFTIEEIKQ